MTDPRAAVMLDIIARESGVPRASLVPEASIEALGIPSLDLTQALFEIEEHFDIEIPVVAPTRTDGGAQAEFVTIGDLLAHAVAVIDRTHPATGPAVPGTGPAE